jgi:hypothetical protein
MSLSQDGLLSEWCEQGPGDGNTCRLEASWNGTTLLAMASFSSLWEPAFLTVLIRGGKEEG